MRRTFCGATATASPLVGRSISRDCKCFGRFISGNPCIRQLAVVQDGVFSLVQLSSPRDYTSLIFKTVLENVPYHIQTISGQFSSKHPLLDWILMSYSHGKRVLYNVRPLHNTFRLAPIMVLDLEKDFTLLRGGQEEEENEQRLLLGSSSRMAGSPQLILPNSELSSALFLSYASFIVQLKLKRNAESRSALGSVAEDTGIARRPNSTPSTTTGTLESFLKSKFSASSSLKVSDTDNNGSCKERGFYAADISGPSIDSDLESLENESMAGSDISEATEDGSTESDSGGIMTANNRREKFSTSENSFYLCRDCVSFIDHSQVTLLERPLFYAPGGGHRLSQARKQSPWVMEHFDVALISSENYLVAVLLRNLSVPASDVALSTRSLLIEVSQHSFLEPQDIKTIKQISAISSAVSAVTFLHSRFSPYPILSCSSSYGVTFFSLLSRHWPPDHDIGIIIHHQPLSDLAIKPPRTCPSGSVSHSGTETKTGIVFRLAHSVLSCLAGEPLIACRGSTSQKWYQGIQTGRRYKLVQSDFEITTPWVHDLSPLLNFSLQNFNFDISDDNDRTSSLLLLDRFTNQGAIICLLQYGDKSLDFIFKPLPTNRQKEITRQLIYQPSDEPRWPSFGDFLDPMTFSYSSFKVTPEVLTGQQKTSRLYSNAPWLREETLRFREETSVNILETLFPFQDISDTPLINNPSIISQSVSESITKELEYTFDVNITFNSELKCQPQINVIDFDVSNSFSVPVTFAWMSDGTIRMLFNDLILHIIEQTIPSDFDPKRIFRNDYPSSVFGSSSDSILGQSGWAIRPQVPVCVLDQSLDVESHTLLFGRLENKQCNEVTRQITYERVVLQVTPLEMRAIDPETGTLFLSKSFSCSEDIQDDINNNDDLMDNDGELAVSALCGGAWVAVMNEKGNLSVWKYLFDKKILQKINLPQQDEIIIDYTILNQNTLDTYLFIISKIYLIDSLKSFYFSLGILLNIDENNSKEYFLKFKIISLSSLSVLFENKIFNFCPRFLLNQIGKIDIHQSSLIEICRSKIDSSVFSDPKNYFDHEEGKSSLPEYQGFQCMTLSFDQNDISPLRCILIFYFSDLPPILYSSSPLISLTRCPSSRLVNLDIDNSFSFELDSMLISSFQWKLPAKTSQGIPRNILVDIRETVAVAVPPGSVSSQDAINTPSTAMANIDSRQNSFLKKFFNIPLPSSRRPTPFVLSVSDYGQFSVVSISGVSIRSKLTPSAPSVSETPIIEDWIHVKDIGSYILFQDDPTVYLCDLVLPCFLGPDRLYAGILETSRSISEKFFEIKFPQNFSLPPGSIPHLISVDLSHPHFRFLAVSWSAPATFIPSVSTIIDSSSVEQGSLSVSDDAGSKDMADKLSVLEEDDPLDVDELDVGSYPSWTEIISENKLETSSLNYRKYSISVFRFTRDNILQKIHEESAVLKPFELLNKLVLVPLPSLQTDSQSESLVLLCGTTLPPSSAAVTAQGRLLSALISYEPKSLDTACVDDLRTVENIDETDLQNSPLLALSAVTGAQMMGAPVLSLCPFHFPLASSSPCIAFSQSNTLFLQPLGVSESAVSLDPGTLYHASSTILDISVVKNYIILATANSGLEFIVCKRPTAGSCSQSMTFARVAFSNLKQNCLESIISVCPISSRGQMSFLSTGANGKLSLWSYRQKPIDHENSPIDATVKLGLIPVEFKEFTTDSTRLQLLEESHPSCPLLKIRSLHWSSTEGSFIDALGLTVAGSLIHFVSTENQFSDSLLIKWTQNESSGSPFDLNDEEFETAFSTGKISIESKNNNIPFVPRFGSASFEILQNDGLINGGNLRIFSK